MKLHEVPENSYVKLSTGEIVYNTKIDGVFALGFVPFGSCAIHYEEEVELSTKQEYEDYWNSSFFE